jgi:hypothetical protein
MPNQIPETTNTENWKEPTGPLPFRMTNDYLFKYLLQSEEDVLKAIVCSYRDLNPDDIRSIYVMNAIQISDEIADKKMMSSSTTHFSQNPRNFMPLIG